MYIRTKLRVSFIDKCKKIGNNKTYLLKFLNLNITKIFTELKTDSVRSHS